MTEKLQKILSRAGIASRRALEQIISEGRVLVNGKVATIGDRYEAEEITVKLDGKVVLSPESNSVACRVLMYHKPEGELTTLSDPEGRPTVFDHIPKPPTGRWIYIGRLDINTSGLLLFTTDGELANALMHPKFEVERVYASRIYGEVSEEQIESLEKGVMLEDGKARFNKVVYVGGEGRNAWYHVTLKEGRKREVRRLWEAVGLKVSRLIRIRYAGIDLDPDLKTGQCRELSLNELNLLRSSVGLKKLEKAPAPLDFSLTESVYRKAPLKNTKKDSKGRKTDKAEKSSLFEKKSRGDGRGERREDKKSVYKKTEQKNSPYSKSKDYDKKSSGKSKFSSFKGDESRKHSAVSKQVVSYSSFAKDDSPSKPRYAFKTRSSNNRSYPRVKRNG
ncbi:MAG: 23S rRNA pseudouridine(2605) synthase RluB [Succinivibrio sp.]